MGSMQKLNGWVSDTDASELSRELRLDHGEYLPQRRRVAALSMVSLGMMGIISLYQMGVIRHLPDPPLPMMDSDKVDAAPEAYRKLRTPDAVLGLVSYSATLTLAAMGSANRAREQPLIPLALAGKAVADAAQAAKLTWSQWAEHKAFCFYCLTAAAATFAVLPAVVPEAREALRNIK